MGQPQRCSQVSAAPYTWEPMVLPSETPLPMLSPQQLTLNDPVLLDAPTAEFLSLGCGRVDMGEKWMWSWDSRGLLRLFRTWTGWEIYRLHMRPVTWAPGPTAWRVESGWCESSPERFSLDGNDQVVVLTQALSAIANLQSLDGVPASREAVTQLTTPPNAPWPAALDVLADAINSQLPRHLLRLWMRDREVNVPDGVVLQAAYRELDAVGLQFSDGAQLWIQQAWRVRVLASSVATDVGGVLLWPGRQWTVAQVAATWGVLRLPDGGVAERVLGPDGEATPTHLLGREVPGHPDQLVQLDLERIEGSESEVTLGQVPPR